MSDMVLLTPTKLLLPSDGDSVKSFLTFTDRQIQYQIKRLKGNFRWANSDPEGFKVNLERLKEQLTPTLIFYDDEGRPYTYSGLWKDLQERFKWNLNKEPFDESKVRSVPWKKNPFDLRYYQKEAIEALVKAGHGAIELPTGSGKSAIISSLCKKFPVKTLIVTPSAAITDQLYRDFQEQFGQKYVGKYGDGRKDSDKLFTIGVAQSLTLMKTDTEAYSNLSKSEMFIFDECFPYGTGVITNKGCIKIGRIHQMLLDGDDIQALSFNAELKDFEYKKITMSWQRAPKDKLIKITTGARSICCTNDHKILTTRGWISAEVILPGDLILGNRDESQAKNSAATVWNDDQHQIILGSYLGDGSISCHRNKYRLRIIHGIKQKDYLLWKNSVLNENKIEIIKKNGYSQKPAVRFTTKLFNSNIKFSVPKGEGLRTVLSELDARGLAVWFMDDGNLSKSGSSARLHTESLPHDSQLQIVSFFKEKFNIESSIIEDKGADWCYYNIYFNKENASKLSAIISPYVHETMKHKTLHSVGKYKWNPIAIKFGTCLVTDVSEIESVELLNQSQRRNIKRNACNLNLYDLEVESNHNFIVSGSGTASGGKMKATTGMIVHNCHTAPAETFERVCMGVGANAKLRFFTSATQMRTDGCEMILKGITGPIVYRQPFKTLVSQGFLKKPIFKLFNVPAYDASSYRDVKMETRKQLYENPNVNKLAAEIAQKAVTIANRPTVIIIEEFKQFALLKNYLSIPFEFVHGGASSQETKDIVPQEFWKSDTEQSVKNFNEGKTKLLIGTSAISTGVDLKPVGCLIYLQGGTSEIKVRQAIGRGTRIVPELKDFWVVDFNVVGSPACERHFSSRKELYEDMSDEVTVHG